MLGFNLEGLGWYTYEIVRNWLIHHPEVRWTLIFDRQSDLLTEFDVERVILKPKTSHTPSIAYWNEGPLTRWLRKHKPAIYFSPDGFIPLRSSVKCVAVVHDLAPLVYPQYMRWRDYIYYRLFQIRMIKRASHVFTVSEFSKNEIIRCSSKKPEHITVAYNGLHSGFESTVVSSVDLHSLGITEPFFMYYGSVHPRKNVFGLIKSFELYRQNGGQAQLVISGRRAWMSKEIEDLLAASDHAKAVVWLPYLDGKTLKAILIKSTGLIYISHYEGFGLPVLEAMASGVPVITSANSSMSEIGGDAVITCDSVDHISVAEWMTRIEADSQLQEELKRKGKERAKAYSYFQSSEKILKILKSLVVGNFAN